ncbi:MAG: trigger factor [Pedobacter sp.]|nr:MAG: trigger factor [Pedobacter sp.]
MDIIQDKIDHLNSVLTVKINPDDYLARVEKAIKEQAKKVKMPGFRPGMVPSSHIKRVYGKEILVDEINKLLSDTLNNYIAENKLQVLGQPLPKAGSIKEFNWDFKDEFEFIYEMGLAPEFTVDFSSKDQVKHYVIKADGEVLASRISNLRKGYGKRSNPEVSADDDVLLVELKQLATDGSLFEGGISNTASLRLDKIKDAEIKKRLIGLSKDSVVSLDIRQAFADDMDYLAKLLAISEADAGDLTSAFQVTIKNINRLEESDLDQEFFDKVFGKDVVKTKEAFEEKVTQEIESMMVQNAEQRLQYDLYQLGLEKFNVDLPDAFLKRWLKATNEKITDQELEEGYAAFVKQLKWTLIENQIIKENHIEIKYEEIFQAAKSRLEAQFKMYAPGALPADQLDQYATTFLRDKDNLNRTLEEVKASHVFDYLKNVVTLGKVEITSTEFSKLT